MKDLTVSKSVLCDGVIARQMVREGSGEGERRPTDFRVAVLARLGMLGLFSFDPVHIGVFTLKNFLFPFLHVIEEYL